MKKFIIRSLCTILLIIPVVASANPAYMTENFDNFSRTLRADLDKNRKTAIAKRDPILMRSLVFEQFCQTMEKIGETNLTPTFRNITDGVYYNPKHSVFIHVVCDRPGYNDVFKTRSTTDEKTYFLKDNWTALGVY